VGRPARRMYLWGCREVKNRVLRLPVALLVLGLALAVLAGCSSQPAATATQAPSGGASQSAIKGDATAGKTLYDSNCASCHGANAAGGTQIGSVTSADIRGPALQQKYSGNQEAIEQAILNGKGAGRELNQAMPRWQGKLTTEQVDNIIAYLYTLK